MALAFPNSPSEGAHGNGTVRLGTSLSLVAEAVLRACRLLLYQLQDKTMF